MMLSSSRAVRSIGGAAASAAPRTATGAPVVVVAAPPAARRRQPFSHAAVAARAQAGQGQQKVNKRGKVASRPGPQNSRKEEAKQVREERLARRMQGDEPPEQQREEGDGSGAPSSSSSAGAEAAPVDASLPSSSSSSSSSPSSSSATTPQVVVDRMFRRMVVSAGLPVLLALFLLPAFWYARVVAKIEYPPWLVYLVQGGLFGGGLLGITYGILSTSWEPRREGTALGFDEFRANVALLLSRRKQQ